MPNHCEQQIKNRGETVKAFKMSGSFEMGPRIDRTDSHTWPDDLSVTIVSLLQYLLTGNILTALFTETIQRCLVTAMAKMSQNSSFSQTEHGKDSAIIAYVIMVNHRQPITPAATISCLLMQRHVTQRLLM